MWPNRPLRMRRYSNKVSKYILLNTFNLKLTHARVGLRYVLVWFNIFPYQCCNVTHRYDRKSFISASKTAKVSVETLIETTQVWHYNSLLIFWDHFPHLYFPQLYKCFRRLTQRFFWRRGAARNQLLPLAHGTGNVFLHIFIGTVMNWTKIWPLAKSANRQVILTEFSILKRDAWNLQFEITRAKLSKRSVFGYFTKQVAFCFRLISFVPEKPHVDSR